jgi:hypothetical protein
LENQHHPLIGRIERKFDFFGYLGLEGLAIAHKTLNNFVDVRSGFMSKSLGNLIVPPGSGSTQSVGYGLDGEGLGNAQACGFEMTQIDVRSIIDLSHSLNWVPRPLTLVDGNRVVNRITKILPQLPLNRMLFDLIHVPFTFVTIEGDCIHIRIA